MEEKNAGIVRFKVFGYLSAEAWEIVGKHSATGKLDVPLKMLGKLRGRIPVSCEQNSKLSRYFYIPIIGNKATRLEKVAKIIGDRNLASRLAHAARSEYKLTYARALRDGVVLAAIDFRFDVEKIKEEIRRNPFFRPRPETVAEEIVILNPENKSYSLQIKKWDLSSFKKPLE